MAILRLAERLKGKPFSEWSEAELRADYLVLARAYDMLWSGTRAQPSLQDRWKTRPAPLRKLLTTGKETRGRKQEVPITDDELLDLVPFGRGLGHRTAKASFLDYAKWYLEQKGQRLIGNQERIAKRLQKRHSEARKFRNK